MQHESLMRTKQRGSKRYVFRFRRPNGGEVTFSSVASSMAEALERLRARFPDAEQIQVVRSSAPPPAATVRRNGHTISYLMPVVNPRTAELLTCAARDFSHLLHVGEACSWQELAQRIRTHYDTRNPRTAEIVRACERVAA